MQRPVHAVFAVRQWAKLTLKRAYSPNQFNEKVEKVERVGGLFAGLQPRGCHPGV